MTTTLPASIKKVTAAKLSKILPALYSTEEQAEKIIKIKFFTPFAGWTWYPIEFDGVDTFFGYVEGIEKEMGYFTLSELQSVRGPAGMTIEVDKWFKPTTLSDIRK